MSNERIFARPTHRVVEVQGTLRVSVGRRFVWDDGSVSTVFKREPYGDYPVEIERIPSLEGDRDDQDDG